MQCMKPWCAGERTSRKS